MKDMREVKGIIPVLSTPISEDEKIDRKGLKELVDFLCGKEIGGLWVLGTGSEDMNLTFNKRLEVAEIVCKSNNGRVPLILGAGFFAMEDILSFVDKTYDLEFDAYHVMPYHPLLGLDRIEWFYRYIADKCGKPLWMYTSANWSRAVTPGLIMKLKEHPNIAGIKFSTRNAVDVLKVTGMAERGFQVITAVASQLYACLSMGSKGHTSSLGSCLPELLIEIYKDFYEKKYDDALSAQHKLNKFLEMWPKTVKEDNFLQAAEEKFILSLRGICQPYTTSYYRDLDDGEKDSIRKALEAYNLF